MPSKKHTENRKAKRTGKKAKPAKPPKVLKAKKKIEKSKSPLLESPIGEHQTNDLEPAVRERYVITVEDIRGDTSIGDLIVFFPRTRDVLARKGLRLEAEDAGDIYMTLDAFSAMNGIEIRSLVQEIVEVAKAPPIQQPSPQILAPAVL